VCTCSVQSSFVFFIRSYWICRYKPCRYGGLAAFCLWYRLDTWSSGSPCRFIGLELKGDQAWCWVWRPCDCAGWANVWCSVDVHTYWPPQECCFSSKFQKVLAGSGSVPQKVFGLWNREIVYLDWPHSQVLSNLRCSVSLLHRTSCPCFLNDLISQFTSHDVGSQ
jgi:hypothetical protein